MHILLKPFGWRLLTKHLDLCDTLSTAQCIQRSYRNKLRQKKRRKAYYTSTLAIYQRQSNVLIGRINIVRNMCGATTYELSPRSFAISPFASEAVAGLAHMLPTRQKARVVINMGLEHFESHHKVTTFVERCVHYTPVSTSVTNLLGQLGIPSDYGHQHQLSLIVEPAKLQLFGADYAGRPLWLLPETVRALRRMQHAAQQDEITLLPVSGFRSVGYQVRLIQRKLETGQSINSILEKLAAPGFSEHHSGRAIDLTSPGAPVADETFEQSHAFSWLSRYAQDFGFRMSYPRDNPHAIMYEPWHWYFQE